MRESNRARTPAVTKRASRSKGIINIRSKSPTPTHVFDSYWRFAAERQAIFFRRQDGLSGPWTSDPILKTYKFTNAYRASDRVSQYLIQNVLSAENSSFEDVFLRVMLFKFFNKVGTWELLENELGVIKADSFSYDECDRVLTKAKKHSTTIYSAAYIMPSGAKSFRCKNKHSMHMMLLKKMMDDKLHVQIANAANMGAAFELLRAYPTIGDFLAYQFITDLNYSEYLDFSEMEFVAAGPGARDGIRKCFSDFGTYDENGIIQWVAERQEAEFARREIQFQNLWGRKLQLIDCQNLFCEVDKYARVAHPESVGHSGRTRIKRKYSCNPSPLEVSYPSKWNLEICDQAAVG